MGKVDNAWERYAKVSNIESDIAGGLKEFFYAGYLTSQADAQDDDEMVTITLGLDPDDSWSVIPKERQEALIEDLRMYARRRIAIEGNRAQFSRPLSELSRPPWYGKDIVSVSVDGDFEVGEGFVYNLGKLSDEVRASLDESQ